MTYNTKPTVPDASGATVEAVGKEQIKQWVDILSKYKSSKSNLEERVRSNQQYWRGRHWEEINATEKQIQPNSSWLTNVILGKHSARTDAYPEATVLAREKLDEGEATSLTEIIPCVLDISGFKKAYSQVGWDKEISCAGVYCVTWDANKHNGLGDIAINPVDIYNIFWEPGINDIQESKYVFVTTLVDADVLAGQYPQYDFGKVGTKLVEPSKYVYEDNIDTENKEVVIDVYYKKWVNGKQTLQYAKFVRDYVLYSTENDVQTMMDDMGVPISAPMSETGLYNHGKYPFVFESLYPIKGSICGFSYVDICRNPQDYIDLMGRAIIDNALTNAAPRYFIRDDAGINAEDFNNLNKRLIKCNSIDDLAIKAVEQTALQGNILNYYQMKIDELKQTSGNRDANNGGTEGGVTAASALAILQESGNALSRDENDTAYEAFKEVVSIVIELIRQFYDIKRFFRILGSDGTMKYIEYSNARIKEQMQMGIDGSEYFRLPEFDLEIETSRGSDYSRQSQNNLALQLYQLGFFNPMNAPMVMPCLEMMDFKGKDKMQRLITQMSAMMQPMVQQSVESGNASSNSSPEDDAKQRADKKKAEAESASVEGVNPG